MISFLLAVNLFANVPVYPVVAQQNHAVTTQSEDSFRIGKFLENNWVVLLAAVVFVIRLQNSVEDIKKDSSNKIELLAKDFQIIQASLAELRTQIDKTAGIAKEDVKRVERKLHKHEERLTKFIELVNADRIASSKPIFTFKDHLACPINTDDCSIDEN